MNAKYCSHLQGAVRFSLLGSGEPNLRERDLALDKAQPRRGAA